jgi:uncharacterized protein (UPF0332 family)
MEKDKIKWCLIQKKGIKLVETNDNLSLAYLNEANETLDNMLKIEGKWKVITAYYACYNAFYSILIKCGIKCEIHSCSIELMDFFNFVESDKEFMFNLKQKRINAQYYLKEEKLEDINKVKEFIINCKKILGDLNYDNINSIRKRIEEIKNDL